LIGQSKVHQPHLVEQSEKQESQQTQHPVLSSFLASSIYISFAPHQKEIPIKEKEIPKGKREEGGRKGQMKRARGGKDKGGGKRSKGHYFQVGSLFIVHSISWD